MIDNDKLKSLLAEDDFDLKQFSLFLDQMNDNIRSIETINDLDRYEWALRKGFFPDQVEKYGLTEDNVDSFLSTYAYFKMHPFNNFFRMWINDKFTLRYFLGGATLACNMPEYYLYIENSGQFTYLVNAPEDIAKGKKFLLELLQRRKMLAAKPNNATSSKGFIKFEYLDTRIFMNNEEISEEQYLKETSELHNYIFTEYISQHADLRDLYAGSEAVIRCNMYKIPDMDPCAPAIWRCANCYLTVGTNKSGTATNEARDAICIAVDFATGMLSEQGVYHKAEQSDLEWISLHPDTGFAFSEYSLPEWEQLKSVVMKSCNALSSLDWLGIDLIITDSNPKILEINSLAGIDMPQMICGAMLKDENVRDFFNRKGLRDVSTDKLYEIIKGSYVSLCE